MSGPMSQGPPPPYGAPAQAPAQSPSPMWAAGGSYLPNMRHDPWGMISFVSRAAGFLLVFIAVLVIVAFVSIPGNCVTTPSNCGPTFLSNAYTAVVVAKVLAILGLAALGFGAAVKLHYGLRSSGASSPDEGRIIAAERRANGALFITSIVLLVIVGITVNILPVVTVP
jgi:hypothetical protein